MAQNGRRKGDSTLILAIASGQSVRDAASAAGVGERTAYRRLEAASFRRQIEETRARMVDRAVGKLADAACEAAKTLVELLVSKSDSVKLGAARSLLEIGAKLRETVELETRLSDLEHQVTSKTTQNGGILS